MLVELDKLFTPSPPSGLGLIECAPTLTPAFLFIHFISNFTKRSGQIIFVSMHTSAELFRISMSKMAQRVDSSRFNFIALKDFFKDSLELDAEYILLQIFEEIRKRIKPDQQHLLIFDDLFFLSLAGFTPSKILQFLQRIRQELPTNSLLLVSGALSDKLPPYVDSIFNLRIQLSPIGNGFGKNITGKLEVIQRDSALDLRPQRTELHYFCGQRSAKAFVPGSIQMLM